MDEARPTAGPAKTESSGEKANGGSSHSNRRGGRLQGRGGGRGGRGRGQSHQKNFGSSDRGGRHKKTDMGRGEYNRADIDKRKRNAESQAKRRQLDEENGGSSAIFTKEEIEAEGRKPKKKVAVMIGYAGSGYKGMQINDKEKTIEGDLFSAFVKSGAISKANADDPKKSSLVRCARTDKGVHAAGNVISLKLIVEDPKIVEKINEHLPPQIRVWGIQRTNGSFSCYQTCDSRWYEYLIPTFSFLPPYGESYLGKKLLESAEKEGVLEDYKERQKDGTAFWEDFEENYLKPILDKLDPELQTEVISTINSSEESDQPEKRTEEQNTGNTVPKDEANQEDQPNANDLVLETIKPENSQADKPESEGELRKRKASEELDKGMEDSLSSKRQRTSPGSDNTKSDAETTPKVGGSKESDGQAVLEDQPEVSKSVVTPLEAAVKEVKAAFITAKKAYRISDERRQRVQEVLNMYLGTRNFHNYTIQKKFSDASAKRVIRSFRVGDDPVIINNTEWLSIKVHGQSFMMHQIRKMVGMAALVVRCGSPMSIVNESYTAATISIPKAPGLGLLLERPVFQTYNDRAMKDYSREKIDFDKFKKEIDEFKQREIYDRIFREEERDHQFHSFFHHIDHYRTEHFLWVTASGLSAAKQSQARKEDNSDDEVDINGEEG
ncbi:pseudouridine synthase [Bisporella sp. PMI_857]|nr:pseudouridine synthase [Bisporella sp. PMI_857]